jgi:sugar (pentulose or hexulose) kinase
MRTVCIDVGSSAVKAALFEDETRVGEIVREAVVTRFEGRRAEIDAEPLWAAVVAAVRALGPQARSADRVAVDVLSPGFLAMTRAGDPLTPAVTHQDRRSPEQAAELERRVGKERHLSILGCRPFPGGIASSTLLWWRDHLPDVYRSAPLFGQFNTFLNLRMTGEAVVDPGNASFMGVFDTFRPSQDRWSEELCEAVGVTPDRLPRIQSGETVAGRLRAGPAGAMGLREGAEVLTGLIDTSASIASTGAVPGRVFNSIGTTDVLAVVTDRPRPDERLLTRALGVGGLWVAVNTIAAGGGSLTWAKDNLFPDLSRDGFFKLAGELAAEGALSPVTFRPYLAGDRMSIEPKTAAFENLTMATGRREMLKAVLDAWAAMNAEGLRRLSERADPLLPDVYVSGGADGLAASLHSRWPAPASGPAWRFHNLHEAGLSGLARLACRGV